MDGSASDVVVGSMMIVFGVVGLYLAAGARDIEIYVFGLSLAVLATTFVAGQIKRHFDQRDAVLAQARSGPASQAGGRARG